MNSLNSVRLVPSFDYEELKARMLTPCLLFENGPEKWVNDDALRILYENEVLHLITPTEFGGRNAAVADLIWYAKLLGYSSPSLGATFIGHMLGYSAVVLHGSPELKKKICTDFQSKKQVWAFAMTEGEAGSDLLKTATKAEKVKGGYRLSGEKRFITNAPIASHVAVFAQTFENGKALGISCFYVDASSEGISTESSPEKVGFRKAKNGKFFFKNVFVPDAHRLGKGGDGLGILTHCLNRSKTLLGALAVGVATRAADLVANRLASTERYNKRLLDQPAIKHTLARIHLDIEAAWLLAARAASTWDAGLPAVKEASMAKLFGGSIATKASLTAMELFGARGFFVDEEIHRLWGDAKAVEIVEGPSLVQELLIAKEVLPRERGGFVDVYTIPPFEGLDKKVA